MEVDGDIVDEELLHEFRCLATQDKDELIKQLQILLGNNLSCNSAAFFLDMNNWNLQAAVGSYFDFEVPPKLPSMCLVRDDTSSEGLNVPPSTLVDKVWVLLNNGDESWPIGCHLQFTGGDILSSEERILVEALTPRQTTSVSVQLKAPQEPGMYKSKWRMVTPTGAYFGDIIWVIMTVLEVETSELAQQLAHLSTLGGYPQRPDTSNMANPFSSPNRSIYHEHQINDSNKMC